MYISTRRYKQFKKHDSSTQPKPTAIEINSFCQYSTKRFRTCFWLKQPHSSCQQSRQFNIGADSFFRQPLEIQYVPTSTDNLHLSQTLGNSIQFITNFNQHWRRTTYENLEVSSRNSEDSVLKIMDNHWLMSDKYHQ